MPLPAPPPSSEPSRAGRVRAIGASSESVGLVFGAASVAAAIITIFADKSGREAVSLVFTLATLVPWAFVAGGIRLPLPLFCVATLVPAFAVVGWGDNVGGSFLAMLTVGYVASLTASPRLLAPVLAAGVVLPFLHPPLSDQGPQESGSFYFVGGIGISWLFGHLLRSQGELVRALEDTSGRLGELAAQEERRRIAREVHDVVAHSLTVVLLNVTGARRALRQAPELADEALARAEEVGRESLDAVRRTVGLLREQGEEVPVGAAAPLPTLDDLPALLDDLRAAGLAVEADLHEPRRPVHPAVALVAYRVVQEALANVLRHAPGALARVEVGEQRGHLQVRVENQAPVVAVVGGRDRRWGELPGLGLRGMAERAASVGGTCAAGPTPGGGWQVVASLPLRATGGA